MKLFFNSNKGKLTTHKPRGSRSFAFTDKDVREMNYDPEARSYSDKLCPGLRIIVSPCGNHAYIYKNPQGSKVIGDIYSIDVKQAREIVNNIKENMPEFLSEYKSIKMNLFGYFQKYGPYPHKDKDEEVKGNVADLQQKVEEMSLTIQVLTEENERLNNENKILNNKLKKIRVICVLDEHIDVVDEESDNDDDNVA